MPRDRRLDRAERTERFLDMRFGLLAAAERDLGETNTSVSTSEISIERQRSLKFGNGLRGTVGEILYPAHAQMPCRMIGSRGQDLDGRSFGGREANRPIDGKLASMT